MSARDRGKKTIECAASAVSSRPLHDVSPLRHAKTSGARDEFAAGRLGVVAEDGPNEARSTVPVRAVVLHAHDITRHGLAAMVATLPFVELACSSCYVELVREALREGSPDVLIVPADLGDSDFRLLVEGRAGRLRILALVSDASSGCLSAAAKMEADGYVMAATLSIDELASAILAVVGGELHCPPELASHLLLQARATNESATGRRRTSNLTPRERQVLALLADGLSNKQIARRLGISPNGAKRHVAAILTKLGTANRAGAVSIGLARGWMQPERVGVVSAPG